SHVATEYGLNAAFQASKSKLANSNLACWHDTLRRTITDALTWRTWRTWRKYNSHMARAVWPRNGHDVSTVCGLGAWKVHPLPHEQVSKLRTGRNSLTIWDTRWVCNSAERSS